MEDYLKWLSNENNGVLKTRNINGITISVKYLPPQYQAYQEAQKNPDLKTANFDSLLQHYNKSIAFLLTLKPDEQQQGTDVMYKGISSYEEYKERVYQMNFGMEDKIYLKTSENTYRPVLSGFENNYGLKHSGNIILVFVPVEQGQHDFYQSEKLDIVFEDDLFNTGINHFVFERADLNNVPNFNFRNKS